MGNIVIPDQNLFNKSIKPHIVECLIAVTFDNVPIIVKHNGYPELIYSCYLEEILTTIKGIPVSSGVYKCLIEIQSSICNDPEDLEECDLSITIKSTEKIDLSNHFKK